ncbi:MAG: IPT/TIG domain-containing protein [Methanoregula sp.]|nr:IPT/TIG domain-containing protein [Methanoregula sp.]
MENGIRNGLLICAILVFAVLIAGCSDQSSAGTTTPVPTTVIPAAKFAAGDIIAKSASSTDRMLYVITQYDTKNDMYTRAWIHKNTDGSWGYFRDNKTEKVERVLVEKVYPVKISHVTVSSIAIVTPTLPPTVVTTLSGSAPTVTGISPASGARNAVVGATITGTNFESGATAKLTRAGYPSITATGVSVSSATSIGCTFSLSGADEGRYNVMVTNPGGQSDTKTGVFTIGQAPPILTGVSPNTAEVGDTQIPITINGQNFKEGVKVTFIQGTSEIICGTPVYLDATKISCILNVRVLDGGKFGVWDVKVLNIDGQQTGTLTGKFTVTNATKSTT